MPRLQIKTDTLLKPSWLPSGQIRSANPRALLLPVRAGTSIDCVTILHHEGENVIKDQYDSDDHFYIELSKPFRLSGERRWFVWCQHCGLVEDSHSPMTDMPDKGISAERIAEAAKTIRRTSTRSLSEPAAKSKTKAADLGPPIRIPGFGRPRHAYEPICYIKGRPASFCWDEATKHGQRIPSHSGITVNIRKGCEDIEKARELLGRLRINSWYRDPMSNRRVGGARNSRHLYGDAVDFFPLDEPFNLATWRKVCKLYPAQALAAGSGFIHRDTVRGYYAHWLYRGAPSWAATRY